MSKMRYRDHPSFKVLAGEIAKGECVIFVGAGLSVPAGLPSWSELEAVMCKEAGLSRTYSAPRTADCCKTVIGEKKFNSLIQQQVRCATKPTAAHQFLARLPVRIFVTTNYDTLLEDVLQEQKLSYCVLSLGHTAEWMQIGDSCSERQILKIHGCIKHSQSRLIITEGDYLSFGDKHRELISGLASILAKRPILFVGYSLSDWHLLSLLNTVQTMTEGNTPNKYYLGVDLEAPAQTFLERRYGLKVFDAKGATTREQAVLAFFEALVQEFEIPPWLGKMLVELGGNKGPSEVDRQTSLATLFSVFDVVTRMRLALRIEKHEHIQLPMDKVVRAETIDDLLNLVRERKEEQDAAG